VIVIIGAQVLEFKSTVAQYKWRTCFDRIGIFEAFMATWGLLTSPHFEDVG
jgi:hypothetical protein